VDVFESTIAREVTESGRSLLGYFVSEASENDFPGLPVRENEPVVIWFAGFTDETDSIDVAKAAERAKS
jgi:hypothetical protein